MTPDELDELMQVAVDVVEQAWTDSPRLTAFGNATAKLADTQREQVAQLQAEGVTDADLKAWEKARKSSVAPRSTLTVEKVRSWHEKALEKAQAAEMRAGNRQRQLDGRRTQFDHGMLQLSMKYRQRGMETEAQIYRDMIAAQERATHYRHVARKHAAWLERNETA